MAINDALPLEAACPVRRFGFNHTWTHDAAANQISAQSDNNTAELWRFNHFQLKRRPPSLNWPQLDFHNSAASRYPQCTCVLHFNTVKQRNAEFWRFH